MVAIIQLAIASGATVGGLVFDSSGYRATFELSAALLGVAAVLAFLAARVAMREGGKAKGSSELQYIFGLVKD
mgnify:CR=1 FL=1